MSTPPMFVKVICPRCHAPYIDWLRHVNPCLDTFDEAYREACTSVTCPGCSFSLTSGDMAYYEAPDNAAPIVRLEEEQGIELGNWEGERWSWHPRLNVQRFRQQDTRDWLWLFGSATECHRWRYDTREVPKAAPEASSPTFAQALDKHSLWMTPAEVYLALARRWHDMAQTKNSRYQVVAVENVTLVLADFCTSLIQKQCEETELVLKTPSELYGQTYLALAGFLRPQEVTTLRRNLCRSARHTQRQKDVLTRWRSLLKYRDNLLAATSLTIFLYANACETPYEKGTEGSIKAGDAITSERARLEGLLLDELGV